MNKMEISGSLPGMGGVYNTVNFHLYHYAANNPVRYIDPDGRNAYLVVWTTKPGEFGHAAFAVDNYDKDGNLDGTVTFYELGPNEGIDGTDVLKNIEAYYQREVYPKSALDSYENLSAYETHSADGIIEFVTDKETDARTKKQLEKFIASSNVYNAMSRNCSDMAKVGVKSSKEGHIFSLGKERYFIFSYTTPNSLFNDSKDFKNALLLVDPENKTDYSFTDNVVNPTVKEFLNKKINEVN